jgi:hypothetical protein
MVKEKFAAWLRRHKIKFIDFGIVLGLALIVWGYFNAPVNINRMTEADWQNTHIQSLGTITIQKLQANAPYADIRDANKINGIGTAKMAQINMRFTTWDTAKAILWFPLDLVGLVLFFGGLFSRHIIMSDKRYRAKKLDEKLFGDKNVKR